MPLSEEPTLTGSERGAPPTHRTPVSAALGRLRFDVRLCCWSIGLSLITLTVIFALVNFTDIRWVVPGEGPSESAAVVIKRTGPPVRALRSALDEVAQPNTEEDAIDPNLMLSGHDRTMSMLAGLARAVGMIAALALIPLIAIGVLLAVASATDGVDRTASAFSWSVVVALLTLPLGAVMGLPWAEGALWSYGDLVQQIDARRPEAEAALAAEGLTSGTMILLARYLLLPLAAMSAVAMVGLRFDAGVASGLLRREDLTLDSSLEHEAANVRASTLHGGRTAAAMRTAMSSGTPIEPVKVTPESSAASLRQLSTGEPPKRLI